MAQKEAHARIKINKLLEEAGWLFFDSDAGKANVVLESNVKLATSHIDALGENFEKTAKGFIDFLLLDAKGFLSSFLRRSPRIRTRSSAKNRLVSVPALKTAVS